MRTPEEIQHIEDVQNSVQVGDHVVLQFWAGGMDEAVGTVEAIDPCDGNGCENYPHAEGEKCGEDYVILVEDDQMAYYRNQIVEVNGKDILP